MSQSDFQRKFSQQERPFAAGSVRGVRAWSTPVRRPADDYVTLGIALYGEARRAEDPTGVLTGQNGGTWVAGENVAECQRQDPFMISLGGVQYRMNPLTLAIESPTTPERCDVVHPDCTCGFYAYWTVDAASVTRDCNVIGVVEAYGKVTVGEKGFRAEKAKILAVAPIVDRLGDVDDSLAEAIEKVREQYPDVAVFANTRAMLAEFPPDEAPEIEDEPALDPILANAMQQVRQGGMVYAPSPFTSSMAGLSLSFNTSSIHPPLANSGARQSLSHLFVDELLEPRDPWWIRHLTTIVAVSWALATGCVAWLIGGA